MVKTEQPMKIVLTSALMICSLGYVGSTLARSFNGLYLGVHGGALVSRTQATTVMNIIAPAIRPTQTNLLAGQGIFGGGHLGGGGSFNDFYMGIEVNGSLSSLKGSTTGLFAPITIGASETLRMRDRLGVFVRFGPIVRQVVLPYLKFGAVHSMWQLDTNTGITPDTSFSSPRQRKRFTGFFSGLGCEFLVTQAIILGVETGGEFYQGATFKRVNARGDSFLYSVRPRTFGLNVRLSYLF